MLRRNLSLSTTEKLLNWFNPQPEAIELPVLDLSKPTKPSSSWMDSISNAIGWLNPLKRRSNRQQLTNVMLTSVVIMSAFKTVSAVCMRDQDGRDYELLCHGPDDENAIFNVLADKIGVYLRNPEKSCMAWASVDIFSSPMRAYPYESKDYGSSYFGSSICTLGFYKEEETGRFDPIINGAIHNGTLITPEKVWIGLGVSVPSLIILSGIGCCLFNKYKSKSVVADNIEAAQPLLEENQSTNGFN